MQNQDIINIMNSWGIRGKDPSLILAVQKAVDVAPYDVPVLITGENGTGKDVFHKILHEGSRRRHAKRLAINCGGLPEDTITSELFGHVKGAYTGSVSDRKGYFEEADGGTLFLDEVGDLPLSVQAKLLRVLESGEIIRMGSSEVRKVDVRIVAATNVDLPRAIREGKFREDLYYRLSTITIHVPALRERKEDIFMLFRYFANEVSKKYHMTDRVQLTDQSRLMIEGYRWPGNVRQLLHLVEELSITEVEQRIITPDILKRHLPVTDDGPLAGSSDNLSSESLKPIWMMIMELKRELDEVRTKLGMHTADMGKSMTPALLPSQGTVAPNAQHTPILSNAPTPSSIDELEVEELGPVDTPPTANGWTIPAQTEGRPLTLDEIQKQAIIDALRRNNGNKRRAAEELNISERTIHRKIQEFKLEDD